jgi:hypothetical protein
LPIDPFFTLSFGLFTTIAPQNFQARITEESEGKKKINLINQELDNDLYDESTPLAT